MSGLLSGVLPKVYSGGNKLRRLLGDFINDPMASIEQTMGRASDDLREVGELQQQAFKNPKRPLQITDQSSFNRLADLYMNSVMNFAPIGMNVWHGSPHTFDRFDSSKIGTGEGAQAYGHGLYLAESQDVAKGYASKLSDTNLATPAGMASRALTDNAGDLVAARQQLYKQYNESTSPAMQKAALKAIESLNQGVKPSNLYKVDLPDEAIAKMLDWDKLLSQQSKEVQEAVNRVGRSPEPYGLDRVADDMRMVEMQKLFQSREGVEALRKQGIPGIRYLDQGSRGTGQGTSNFVVFPGNESLLTILDRNGEKLNKLNELIK